MSQPSESEWTLSNEREFMENLLQQRFDFLLVVYSLFVAGALSTDSQLNFRIALTAGSVLCFLLSLTVFRIYVTVDVILQDLHKMPSHPVNLSAARIKEERCCTRLFAVNRIIGWIVPLVCTLSLASAAVCAWLGILTAC